MEDDKLKSLFSDFEPALSSDAQFVSRLRQNMNSVELIRRHTAEVRSRNKKAVAIAAVMGFVIGFLFSLLLPYLSDAVSDWQLTLPDESIMNTVATNFYLIAWMVIGCTSVLAALNTYEVSVSLLKRKEASAC